VQAAKTGALAVAKAEPGKTVPAPSSFATITVLGSRIRQTETAGPSPVSTYGPRIHRGDRAMTFVCS